MTGMLVMNNVFTAGWVYHLYVHGYIKESCHIGMKYNVYYPDDVRVVWIGPDWVTLTEHCIETILYTKPVRRLYGVGRNCNDTAVFMKSSRQSSVFTDKNVSGAIENVCILHVKVYGLLNFHPNDQ